MQIFSAITGENCPNNASNTATMVPVGYFKVTYTNSSEVSFSFKLSQNEKIEWPGGSPPEDSPKCGFDNDKCNPPDSPVGESGMTIYYMTGSAIPIFPTWERRVEQGKYESKQIMLPFSLRIKYFCPSWARYWYRFFLRVVKLRFVLAPNRRRPHAGWLVLKHSDALGSIYTFPKNEKKKRMSSGIDPFLKVDWKCVLMHYGWDNQTFLNEFETPLSGW